MRTPPACPSEGSASGWGGKGFSMPGWGAGTGGKTCTLTSWLNPSPLGPGVAPRPWGGLADGAHATISRQEVAQKYGPITPRQEQEGKKGPCRSHSGSKRKYLHCTYTRVREGLGLPQAVPGDQRKESTVGIIMLWVGSRPAMPSSRAW
jgi:hypothetical protein